MLHSHSVAETVSVETIVRRRLGTSSRPVAVAPVSEAESEASATDVWAVVPDSVVLTVSEELLSVVELAGAGVAESPQDSAAAPTLSP
jgi:hypothetical protein